MIQRIKPLKPEPVITPQCDAPFDQSVYNDTYRKSRAERCERHGWSADRCARESLYKIEGKCFCNQHAGHAALKILLRDS